MRPSVDGGFTRLRATRVAMVCAGMNYDGMFESSFSMDRYLAHGPFAAFPQFPRLLFASMKSAPHRSACSRSPPPPWQYGKQGSEIGETQWIRWCAPPEERHFSRYSGTPICYTEYEQTDTQTNRCALVYSREPYALVFEKKTACQSLHRSSAHLDTQKTNQQPFRSPQRHNKKIKLYAILYLNTP